MKINFTTFVKTLLVEKYWNHIKNPANMLAISGAYILPFQTPDNALSFLNLMPESKLFRDFKLLNYINLIGVLKSTNFGFLTLFLREEGGAFRQLFRFEGLELCKTWEAFNHMWVWLILLKNRSVFKLQLTLTYKMKPNFARGHISIIFLSCNCKHLTLFVKNLKTIGKTQNYCKITAYSEAEFW